jgi:RhtB (resistance to homoserine/threonine) family protein
MDPQILTFFLVAGLLTLTPGADTLLVLRSVLSGGRSSGLATTCGICSGLFVHATLSSLGLSVILVRSASAYEIVKLAGAAYLIFLGGKSLLQAIPHPAVTQSETIPAPEPGNKTIALSFRDGFLTNLLNPKVAIFYLAFLPQFLRPGDPVFAKSILLASIHAAQGLVWLGFLSFALAQAGALIQNASFRRWLEGISGVVLIGLGVRLALEKL